MKSKQNIYERLGGGITKQDNIFTNVFIFSLFLYMPMLFLYDHLIREYKNTILLRPLYELYQDDVNVFAIFLPPAIPIIFTGGLFYTIIKVSRSSIVKLLAINSDILKEIQNATAKKHSIEEILAKSIILQKHVISLSHIALYFFWIKSDVKNLLKNHINEMLTCILNTLKLLQRQLLWQIQREKSILQKQQFEVKENITGNNYLNQVSELQSNRLKRQIEQFEKLQNILH